MRQGARSLRSPSPLIFLGALLAGAFLVLIGVSLAKEVRRRVLLETHIRQLRADIEARERRIHELRSLLEYLGTDAYVERVARETLSYQKPGEQVVVVPTEATPTPTATTALVPSRPPDPSPARGWFALLFRPFPPPGAVRPPS